MSEADLAVMHKDQKCLEKVSCAFSSRSSNKTASRLTGVDVADDNCMCVVCWCVSGECGVCVYDVCVVLVCLR